MAHVALIHERLGGAAGGGGSARLVTELGRGLQAAGHRVTFCCYEHGPSVFEEPVPESRVRAVVPYVGSGRTMGSTLRRYWQGMARVADTVPADADVINAHEWMGLRAGALASRRTGTPLVWTRSDETPWEQGLMPEHARSGPLAWPARVARTAHGIADVRHARQAEAVVVTSEHDAWMVERAYRRRATVIRQPPGSTFFDPPPKPSARGDLGVAPEEMLVVSFAIQVPYRRSEDLIEAAALLAEIPGLRVIIAGSDHEDPAYVGQLRRLVAERGLGGRVEVRGEPVTDDHLRTLLAAADAFVFPSRRQSYGLAPLEALASGTPVVVSSGAGVSEVIEGRAGVHVVPPGDPRAIAQALRMTRDDDGGDALEETRGWLRSNLTSARYAQAMAVVFEEVVKRRRNADSRPELAVPTRTASGTPRAS